MRNSTFDTLLLVILFFIAGAISLAFYLWKALSLIGGGISKLITKYL